MDPTLILSLIPLITEILKTFNLTQAGKPAEQVRAEGLIAWNLAKPILNIVLPVEVKKALADNGIKL